MSIISLERFLRDKTEADGHDYEWDVHPDGTGGLVLKVWRVDNGARSLLFAGAMHPSKTVRTGDVFHVHTDKATYGVYFFM